MQIKTAGSLKISSLTLNESVFGRDFNEALIHQIVTAYRAGGRAGTKAQKNRAAVSGGGAKPWRQKGTGRARAGTTRSPLWRKGGVTFAASPRDFSQKINRRMWRAAMCSIFSELLRNDCLLLVEDLQLAAVKTKLLKQKLDDLNLKSTLILAEDLDEKLLLSARNLPHVAIAKANQVDPVSLLTFEKVIATSEALKKIEEWLA